MKYILPIVVSLLFTACNDSNQNTVATSDTNITPKEQTAAPQMEKTAVQSIAETNVTEANAIEVNGEAIFNKCKGCHGDNAEKKALGSSQIIKGWEVVKIENALRGYQQGTYGASMKNIMSAQAKALSDEEITKVAAYIHSL